MRLRGAGLPAAWTFALLAGVIPVAVSAVLTAPVAQAQNIGERTVTGTVLDADSNPVVGATVFLRTG